MREQHRLEALRRYAVLDTTTEEQFERAAQLAADVFDAPMAVVSFVGPAQVWAKGAVGIEPVPTSHEESFCAVAIEAAEDGVFVLPDAHDDVRFAGKAAVTGAPHLRFYAGAVLYTPDRVPLGMLCVMDDQPRPAPDPAQLRRLTMLAAMLTDELELRRTRLEAFAQQRLLELAEDLAGIGHWRCQDRESPSIWSEKVHEILGVPRTDTPPSCQNFTDLVIPDDRDRVQSEIRPAWERGVEVATTARIVRPDGELRHISIHARRHVMPNGVSEMVGTVQDVTEQLAALRRAERNEARYRMLAEHAADVISRIRLDGSSNYISPTIEKLIGYTPLQMSGQPAHHFVVEEDRGLVLAALKRIAKGEAEQTVEVRAQHREGYAVWVEVSFNPVHDDAGAAVETIAIIRNIDARKQADLRLAAAKEEAEEQARRALEAERIARLGHWRLDLATRQVIWSETMRELCGVDPKTVPVFGQFLEMCVPTDRDAGWARIDRVLATGEGYENELVRFRRADGELRHFIVSCRVEREGLRPVALVGTVQDVSHTMAIEAALAESEQRFRTVAENATDLILQVAADGRLTYVSPSSRLVLGQAPEDLLGRPINQIMHPEDRAMVDEAIATHMAGADRSGPLRLEFRANREDGREVWLEAAPTFTFDERGARTGTTDVIRDVTDRKHLEAEAQKARSEAEAAAAVKAEFLANMSHELRTPLTSIIGYTSLAAEQPDLGPTASNYVARVADASRALLCLVNDILDFSKLEAGQITLHPQPTPIAKLGRATLDLFAPQAGAKDIHLAFNGCDEELAVLADPDRLRQILLNLVGNAVKFTAEGGVTLRITHDREAERLDVAVEDTGAGIPSEKLAILFQRFSQVDGSLTRAQGGTGLGLAICKGLVEAMGGRIGVDSVEGQGSRFWFSIPAKASDVAVAVDGEAEVDLSLVGLRVLVVDDHPTNRELARLFLAAAGAEVTEAGDGEEAVERASELPFDVILMDVRMPRLGGPEALARIRSEPGPNDTTPILAFTAEGDRAAFDRLRDLGFEDVVPKPLEPVALLAATARAAAPPLPDLDSRDAA